MRGVVAARAALDAAGRRDVPVGFTFAWRWLPQTDREFWRLARDHIDPSPSDLVVFNGDTSYSMRAEDSGRYAVA